MLIPIKQITLTLEAKSIEISLVSVTSVSLSNCNKLRKGRQLLASMNEEVDYSVFVKNKEQSEECRCGRKTA